VPESSALAEDFAVHPGAWDAVLAWLRLCHCWRRETHWHVGKGAMMPVPVTVYAGLDYPAVDVVLRLAGDAQGWDAAKRDEVFVQIQVMERAALPVLQEQANGR